MLPTLVQAQTKPVLAREREARSNVEYCPKVYQSFPSMVKTLEANPNTSCGLRPRLRRDLDHAERPSRECCFHLTAGFLNAPISCLLNRWRCLEPPFGFLSTGIDRPDVLSSCLRLTRGLLGAPKAAWRRQLAAQTLKKLLKSLQKHSRERLGQRSEAQDAPGEPQTTKNIKNTMAFHHFKDLERNLS